MLKRFLNWFRWNKPVEVDFTKRREEMARMRNEEGMTLKEIGARQNPPISRERVRQIIGNTGRGFRASWTKKLIKSGKVILNHWTELPSAPGVKREWQRDWGNHRHVVSKGNVGLGYKFEELASTILANNGIGNELMPNKFVYDIRANNGARIEVTITNVDTSKMKSQEKCLYPTWAVPHRVRDCDFLFAFLPDPKEECGYTYFVIPTSVLNQLKANDPRIRIPYPPISQKPSKWHKYHKRLDLIQNYTPL